MDLDVFFAGYRDDGWGRAAHDPAMMVALLLYAYAIGERSSRRIERRCHEDVAVRVITANQAPDHTTIARFRQRHEAAIGEPQAKRRCERFRAAPADTLRTHINGRPTFANSLA
jgi:transposase